MLTLIFAIMMIVVFGKLIFWAIKAAWGITKVLVTIVLFPLILIGLVCTGAYISGTHIISNRWLSNIYRFSKSLRR